jgi:hypothetical protein
MRRQGNNVVLPWVLGGNLRKALSSQFSAYVKGTATQDDIYQRLTEQKGPKEHGSNRSLNSMMADDPEHILVVSQVGQVY